jgi:uncharacterized membrane protein YgcG
MRALLLLLTPALAARQTCTAAGAGLCGKVRQCINSETRKAADGTSTASDTERAEYRKPCENVTEKFLKEYDGPHTDAECRQRCKDMPECESATIFYENNTNCRLFRSQSLFVDDSCSTRDNTDKTQTKTFHCSNYNNGFSNNLVDSREQQQLRDWTAFKDATTTEKVAYIPGYNDMQTSNTKWCRKCIRDNSYTVTQELWDKDDGTAGTCLEDCSPDNLFHFGGEEKLYGSARTDGRHGSPRRRAGVPGDCDAPERREGDLCNEKIFEKAAAAAWEEVKTGYKEKSALGFAWPPECHEMEKQVPYMNEALNSGVCRAVTASDMRTATAGRGSACSNRVTGYQADTTGTCTNLTTNEAGSVENKNDDFDCDGIPDYHCMQEMADGTIEHTIWFTSANGGMLTPNPEDEFQMQWPVTRVEKGDTGLLYELITTQDQLTGGPDSSYTIQDCAGIKIREAKDRTRYQHSPVTSGMSGTAILAAAVKDNIDMVFPFLKADGTCSDTMKTDTVCVANDRDFGAFTGCCKALPGMVGSDVDLLYSKTGKFRRRASCTGDTSFCKTGFEPKVTGKISQGEGTDEIGDATSVGAILAHECEGRTARKTLHETSTGTNAVGSSLMDLFNIPDEVTCDKNGADHTRCCKADGKQSCKLGAAAACVAGTAASPGKVLSDEAQAIGAYAANDEKYCAAAACATSDTTCCNTEVYCGAGQSAVTCPTGTQVKATPTPQADQVVCAGSASTGACDLGDNVNGKGADWAKCCENKPAPKVTEGGTEKDRQSCRAGQSICQLSEGKVLKETASTTYAVLGVTDDLLHCKGSLCAATAAITTAGTAAAATTDTTENVATCCEAADTCAAWKTRLSIPATTPATQGTPATKGCDAVQDANGKTTPMVWISEDGKNADGNDIYCDKKAAGVTATLGGCGPTTATTAGNKDIQASKCCGAKRQSCKEGAAQNLCSNMGTSGQYILNPAAVGTDADGNEIDLLYCVGTSCTPQNLDNQTCCTASSTCTTDYSAGTFDGQTSTTRSLKDIQSWCRGSIQSSGREEKAYFDLPTVLKPRVGAKLSAANESAPDYTDTYCGGTTDCFNNKKYRGQSLDQCCGPERQTCAAAAGTVCTAGYKLKDSARICTDAAGGQRSMYELVVVPDVRINYGTPPDSLTNGNRVRKKTYPGESKADCKDHVGGIFIPDFETSNTMAWYAWYDERRCECHVYAGYFPEVTATHPALEPASAAICSSCAWAVVTKPCDEAVEDVYDDKYCSGIKWSGAQFNVECAGPESTATELKLLTAAQLATEVAATGQTVEAVCKQQCINDPACGAIQSLGADAYGMAEIVVDWGSTATCKLYTSLQCETVNSAANVDVYYLTREATGNCAASCDKNATGHLLDPDCLESGDREYCCEPEPVKDKVFGIDVVFTLQAGTTKAEADLAQDAIAEGVCTALDCTICVCNFRSSAITAGSTRRLESILEVLEDSGAPRGLTTTDITYEAKIEVSVLGSGGAMQAAQEQHKLTAITLVATTIATTIKTQVKLAIEADPALDGTPIETAVGHSSFAVAAPATPDKYCDEDACTATQFVKMDGAFLNCAALTCNPTDDGATCCDNAAACSTATAAHCPVGKVKKASLTGLYCGGATCSLSNAQDCCEQAPASSGGGSGSSGSGGSGSSGSSGSGGDSGSAVQGLLAALLLLAQ